MNQLAPAVTAIAILAHTLWGCCTTASHGAEASAERAQVVCEASEHRAALGHHEECPADGPHDCCHERCHWGAPGAGAAAALCAMLTDLLADFEACDARRALADAHVALPAARDAHAARSALPVRPHLANSVLLI